MGPIRPQLLACAVLVANGLALAQPLRLHVPSPDWRDQVIYFVMTDRFADGDPSNNDQGAGEFKAGDGSRYNGGDLKGLTERLPYIQGLGATALWVTPPVANQWLSPGGHSAGFHGYWAENFKQVDRHLGSLGDYQRLSDALHRRGMYLVQDIVVNHTGDYFHYDSDRRPGDAVAGFQPHLQTPPAPRPTQPPFDRNDPRDPGQRQAGIYHWTPDIVHYDDPQEVFNFQMAGLDDLNTENPAVRRALRDSHGWWIRQAGVDAFRIDTAFYVPPAYFADFLFSRDRLAPGIAEVARSTGRRQFLVFGEGFAIDRPGQDKAQRQIETYMTGADGRPLLPGMLNFPLYGSLGDVFARGQPPSVLADRIGSMMSLHRRPHLMPSFVDNHDVDRFLSGGSEAALKQALLAMMCLPGIPVIYYGTEQGFTDARAAMFASGYASGGRDHYDTAAPLYRAIADMTALRRAHRVLSRGKPVVLAANATRAGVLAWRMAGDGEAQGGGVLVAMNSSEQPSLLADVATGLAEGTLLKGQYGLDGRPADQHVGPGGRLTLALPGRSGLVWSISQGRAPTSKHGHDGPVLTVAPLPVSVFDDDFTVSGAARGVNRALLVIDGQIGSAQPIEADAQGRWSVTVDTSQMVDPLQRHELIAWAEGQAVSARQAFQVSRPWRLLADVPDPEGDDTGPDGRYLYPTDAGWFVRPMDLRRVRVSTAGGALRLDLTMKAVSAGWNPVNGFDRVAFTIYLELPGNVGGATVMPLQNAELPKGMRWHLRLRAGGWSNALHRPEGASATSEGRPVTPAASIAVDRDSSTISFTLPAAALGAQTRLSGAKIYVTTWDYDSGYRALGVQALPYAFGGGVPDGPKIMDDSAVIVLP